MKFSPFSKNLIAVLFLLIVSQSLNAQKQKKYVLDWLSQHEVVEEFGKISDEIWSFAELGLQEFKSSALLINTLEKEGFKVEKGLAGMPTCFVATYGSGKPVIGILAEYDAKGIATTKDAKELVNSDSVDIVVELGKPDLFYLIGIKQDLEEKFNRPVDIVRYRDRMSAFLKKRIDKEAIYV